MFHNIMYYVYVLYIMYGEYLKCLISFIVKFILVVSIGALFISSPLTFDRLHDDLIFCCRTLVLEVIKEIAATK